MPIDLDTFLMALYTIVDDLYQQPAAPLKGPRPKRGAPGRARRDRRPSKASSSSRVGGGRARSFGGLARLRCLVCASERGPTPFAGFHFLPCALWMLKRRVEGLSQSPYPPLGRIGGLFLDQRAVEEIGAGVGPEMHRIRQHQVTKIVGIHL